MVYQRINGGAGWDEATDLHADHFEHMEDGIVAAVRREGDTMTGSLLLPNGSNSAPALSFANASGMGLFRGASTILSVAIDGQQVMQWDGTTRIRPVQNGVVDLGQSALRWKDGWFGGAVHIGGAQAAKVATGTYAGNNASNRLITLPFAPRLVHITWFDTAADLPYVAGSAPAGLSAINQVGFRFHSADTNVRVASTRETRPELDGSGFRIGGSASGQLNRTGHTYYYTAIG